MCPDATLAAVRDNVTGGQCWDHVHAGQGRMQQGMDGSNQGGGLRSYRGRRVTISIEPMSVHHDKTKPKRDSRPFRNAEYPHRNSELESETKHGGRSHCLCLRQVDVLQTLVSRQREYPPSMRCSTRSGRQLNGCERHWFLQKESCQICLGTWAFLEEPRDVPGVHLQPSTSRRH